MKVSDKLKEVLKNTGVKQYVLAERCGYNPKTFSEILNGRRKVTESDILKICSGLNVKPNDLLEVPVKNTA